MSKLRLVLPMALLAGLGGAAGCASRDEAPIDALESALNAQDYDATVRALVALPYLPWGYTPDGCYARAYYYSALLASKGVPTSSLYVHIKRNTTPLGGQWSWHVAPLVTKDNDAQHLFVLDPVYDSTRALTHLEWVAKQGYSNPASPSYPYLHVHPATEYLKQTDLVHRITNVASPDVSEFKEPTMSEMPKFWKQALTHSCNTMHQYIDREPGTSAAQRREKHTNLGRETQKLALRLVAKDLLFSSVANDPSPLPELPNTCTRATDIGDGGTEPMIDPTLDVDGGPSLVLDGGL